MPEKPRQTWQKRSVPKGNAFKGGAMQLSPSELQAYGEDTNIKTCAACGKRIFFSPTMQLADYVYKTRRSGRPVRYYCCYSCFRRGQNKGR